MSSPPSFFYLKLCGRSGRNCLLSPVLSSDNGFPDTCFFQGTMRLMSWPDGECYLRPLQPLVVSLLFISRIHSCVFSDWRHTVSLKFFDTQIPSISLEELVLPIHACCVLSRLRCNGHRLLLGSYLSRIGRIENPFAAPVETRARILLISFCTVQLWTLCVACSLTTLCFFTTSGPCSGELPGF